MDFFSFFLIIVRLRDHTEFSSLVDKSDIDVTIEIRLSAATCNGGDEIVKRNNSESY